ncbi:MAG TPA: ribonuclease D [Desulfopila sp.]|nr:ribonuclease D [Desulfopila sp.]
MITSTDTLLELVDKARASDAVAIDTEFIWTRTYLPRLGLIQLALSDEDCHLIDPLAIDDLSPLGMLLADQSVIKILHDAPQDLAILHQATGYVPKNIFDTRLAAGFAGLSATLSLGNLIQELLDITLAKTETRTNWLKRPLDDEQVNYALDDVRYLRAARIILINRIIGPEIKSWLQEELDLLNMPENYNGLTSNNRYRRIRGARSLDATGLSILRELSLWRERVAKKSDRPRGHIISDSVLIEISKQRPATMEQLTAKTALSAKAAERWGTTLLEGVKTGLACPTESRPQPDHSVRLNKKNTVMLERLNEFIQLKSTVQGIDPMLIGNSSELKKLVKILNKSCRTEMVRQMEGWRKTFLIDFFRYAN